MTTLPLGEVKSHLSELVGRVHDHHERVTVTVHGRPSAVLVAVEDLERLEETLVSVRWRMRWHLDMPDDSRSVLHGAFESPRQLPRRAIQVFIDAREPRLVGPSATSHLGERSQVNAVETSQAILLGKPARGPTEGIGSVQGQIRRPLLLKRTLRCGQL